MAKNISPKRVAPEGKTQAFFYADETTVNKLKQIANIHGQTNTEVYNQAFEKFVELYEKKNGPVKITPKKKINL